MKTIKILHLADLHADVQLLERFRRSAAEIVRIARETDPQLIAIAGDFWHRRQTVSEQSALDALARFLSELSEIAPVVGVKGNNEHDPPGSVDALNLFRHEQDIRFVERPEVIFLTEHIGRKFRNTLEYSAGSGTILAIQLFPYPTKQWLAARLEAGSVDAGTDQARAALRVLLTGWGVEARQRPFPTLFVGHLNAKGAQLSNGQTLVSQDLVVSGEELALAGARYYALGHIHKPQALAFSGIVAEYSGSIFPINYGEAEKKMVNIIGIHDDGGAVTVKRLALESAVPLAFRDLEVENDPLGYRETEPGEVDDWRGADLRVRFRGRAHDLDAIAASASLEDIVRGRYPGARSYQVEKIVIPDERVRASTIAVKRTLIEQIDEWATTVGLMMNEETRELAREIDGAVESEAEAKGRGYGRPLHLLLRGAIGVRDGMGLDELTLDLRDLENGLVAVVGPNGIGKTTVLECLQPFLEWPSRSGALGRSFTMRDSVRLLIFEVDGQIYRSKVLIDAQSGKMEAYLAREDGTAWIPINDGKVVSYKKAIEELCGPAELFFRSAFNPQGAISISRLTAGERKKLFVELLGLGRFDALAERASKLARETETSLAELEGRRAAELEKAVQIPRLAAAVEAETEKHREAAAEKDRLATEADNGRQVVELVKIRLAERKAAEDKAAAIIGAVAGPLADLDREATEIERGLKEFSREIDRKRKILENADKVREGFTRLTEAVAEAERADEAKRAHDTLESEHNREKLAWSEQLRLAEKTLAEKQLELNREQSRKRQLADLVREEDQRASLTSRVPCASVMTVDGKPLGGSCELLRGAIAAKESAESHRQRIIEVDAQIATFEAEFRELKTKAEEILRENRKLDERLASDGFDRAAWLGAKTRLAQLRREGWDDLRKELDAAMDELKNMENRTAELGRRRVEIAGSVERMLRDRDERLALILAEFPSGEDLRDELERARRELDQVGVKLAEADRLSSELAQRVGVAAAKLEEARSSERTARVMEKSLALETARLARLNLLVKAFGKNGIPALLIDAAGPEIARTANELLASGWGSRFQIGFETTRLDARGRKEIEDFVVPVWVDGERKEIDDLSGGERVPIEKAIAGAFAIYAARSTGRSYGSAFLDEVDGALDPAAKLAFLDMVRKTAGELTGGGGLTFLVTHSSEVQEQVGQKMIFSSGGVSLEL